MKEKQCFNCHHELNEDAHYCPNCGQRVDGNVLKLKVVLTEFYENYLSLDTRLGRSIVPFLLKPGKLTKEFIEGKRVSYLNPFRFYLVVSVFMFFTVGLAINRATDEVSETLKEDVKEEVSILDDIRVVMDSVQIADSASIKREIDSMIAAKNLGNKVKFTIDSVSKPGEKRKRGVFLKTDEDNPMQFNFDVSQFKTIKKYRYDKSYSDKQLLDSLNGTDSLNGYRLHVATQALKLYRSDSKSAISFIVGNFSFGMLFLIPGMALLMMLFYFKSKLPFVGHLIHSLHLHTFLCFIYGLCFIGIYYYGGIFWSVLAFIISAVYMFFSFKRVYQRRVFSSLWRVIVVGSLYYFVWGVTLTVSAFISFLLF